MRNAFLEAVIERRTREQLESEVMLARVQNTFTRRTEAMEREIAGVMRRLGPVRAARPITRTHVWESLRTHGIRCDKYKVSSTIDGMVAAGLLREDGRDLHLTDKAARDE